MGGGGRFFFLKIMMLRTFVFQFKCSSALSVSPNLKTHLHIFLLFSLLSPSLSSWLSEFPPVVSPTGDPLLPSSLFPFGSCNTRCYFGEINLTKPRLPCRALSRLWEGKVCLWDAQWSSLPFVFSSPAYPSLPTLFSVLLLLGIPN